jgi:hypothetical protein
MTEYYKTCPHCGKSLAVKKINKAYVKTKDGTWLVEGSINGIVFNGHGVPYAFTKKEADLICEQFGHTLQLANGSIGAER